MVNVLTDFNPIVFYYFSNPLGYFFYVYKKSKLMTNAFLGLDIEFQYCLMAHQIVCGTVLNFQVRKSDT